jgi:hypothetical protein
VRVPWFLPRIRWWESNPRYRLAVPVSLRRNGTDAALEGEILDLSMGGCFVRIRQELTQDEAVSLRFTVFGQAFDFQGTVVWRTQSTVTHPKGVGIKFAPLQRPQRRVMRAVTARLKQISTFYRTSRYLMNQEDFHRRMQELQQGRLELPAFKAASTADK